MRNRTSRRGSPSKLLTTATTEAPTLSALSPVELVSGPRLSCFSSFVPAIPPGPSASTLAKETRLCNLFHRSLP